MWLTNQVNLQNLKIYTVTKEPAEMWRCYSSKKADEKANK